MNVFAVVVVVVDEGVGTECIWADSSLTATLLGQTSSQSNIQVDKCNYSADNHVLYDVGTYILYYVQTISTVVHCSV